MSEERTAHTPTPWCLGNRGLLMKRDDVGNPWRHIAEPVWPIDELQCVADMQFIAHCVNNYDALIAALRKYGDHYQECSLVQESGKTVKSPCNCGFDAALASVNP